MGLFQAANGGTIFLDEIGELPLEMQAKLLRVLQEKEVRPVGSNDRVKVDVRVVAATNRDLEAAYMNGTFRKDLYFRLNVVTMNLPSLRERKSDIPSLVQYFLEKMSPNAPMTVTPSAMKALLGYSWPGNVRELQNCIERAVALGNRTSVEIDDLPPALREASGVQPEPLAVVPIATPTSTDLEEMERLTIQRVFEQVKGDKTAAGKMLGISRATLYRKIKRYGIVTKDDDSEAEAPNDVKLEMPLSAMAAGMK
jgi:transcriptional regulator with PAS, ATPase and Fis domain